VDGSFDGEGRAVEDPAVVSQVGELEECPVAQVDVVDRAAVVVHTDEDVAAVITQIVGHRAHRVADGIAAPPLAPGAALEFQAGGLLGAQEVGQVHIVVAHGPHSAVRGTRPQSRAPGP
jgi:hypothetical protein